MNSSLKGNTYFGLPGNNFEFINRSLSSIVIFPLYYFNMRYQHGM